jgi:hypothetical protein
MAAGRYDLTIEQGATFSRQVTWQNEDGSAVNLTGYALAGKLRRKTSDQQAIATFTCTITNAGNGIFTFSLTATQTASLPVAYSQTSEKELLECVYDIEASISGTVYRLLEGVAYISPEVTK